MRLSGIFLYPVKGMRAVPVAHSAVEPCGLAGDRRWMLVDAQGRFLSQRRLPALARFTASLTPNGLRLTVTSSHLSPTHIDIEQPGPDPERIAVSLWRSHVRAACAGIESDAWLSARLGQACRLVYLDDPAARPIEAPHGTAGEHVSFADGFPLLLTNEASLAAVNTALAGPVGMERFRPNLVIEGAAAWSENDWRRLSIGGAAFRAPTPCSRCIVITVDQGSGEIPHAGEPLGTLARLNRRPEGIVFGLNLVPLSAGVLRLGDTVKVLE